MATNTTFVTQLYQNVLFRTPTSAEVNSWVGKLDFNELTQSAVAQQFITSPEAQGNPAAVIRLYQSYFGRVPALAEVAFHVNNIRTNGASLTTIAQQFSLSNEFTTRFPSGTNDAFVQNLYTNVLGRSASTAEVSYYNARLAAGESRGSVALSFNQSPEFNTNYGGVVNAALANAGIVGSIPTTLSTLQQQGAVNLNTLTTSLVANPTGGGTGTGQTFTLTTALETATGTSGNDTIVGSVAGTVTLSAGDVVNGGAGTDTLRVAGAGASATTLSGVSISGIEVLELINPGNNAQDLSALSGLTTVSVVDASALNTQSITTAAGVKNLQLATAGNVGTAGAVTWAANAAETALNLTLAGYQGASTATPAALTVTGSGATTVNVTSSGSANAVTTLTLPATTVKTVNISAATNLNVSTSLVATGANSVVVTGAGNVTVAGSDLAASGVTVDASAATGRVSFRAEGGVTGLTFKGGTGADAIIFGAGDLASSSNQSIDGGAGTDTLGINDTTPVYATINAAKNIEVLGLYTTGATVDVSQLTTINSFKTVGNIGATFNNSKSTSTFEIDNAATAGTIAINNAVGETATTVTVNYGTATANKAVTALNVAGASTVNLVSTGTGTGGSNTITTLGNIDNSTITITGSKDLTITNALAATTTGSKVDANAFTGNLSVIGSTKADVLIGGTGNDTLANRAAGSASAGDIMTGGTGNDTFILLGDVASGTVSTILPTASRVTDFTVGASASTGDILSLSATNTNYTAASGFHTGISGATAAGSTVVQSVAQNAASAAVTAGLDLIKLTTAVTTGTTLQAAFNSAIGSATVTGISTGGFEVFFSLYDTTNSRMLIGVVDSGAASTVIETGDTVTLIGSINMTAADYALFGSNNFALVA